MANAAFPKYFNLQKIFFIEDLSQLEIYFRTTNPVHDIPSAEGHKSIRCDGVDVKHSRTKLDSVPEQEIQEIF